MRRYRYTAWTCTPGCFHPDPEDVLDAMADSILEHGDLRKALRRLMLEGVTDARGRQMPGLRDIHRQVLDMRQKILGECDAADTAWDRWLMGMERLDRMLDGVLWGSEADTIDDKLVEIIMGNAACRQVRALKDLAEDLSPYVRRDDFRLELTPSGLRRIAQRAMTDIFASLRRDAFGSHAVRQQGTGGDWMEESRPYRFGDSFAINLGRTIMNAARRGAEAGTPLRLDPQDFEVHDTESAARCATVLLLDMSGSMARHGRFAAAKRVALALDALIRTQFPRDRLQVVGFCTYAEELPVADLPCLTPKPPGFFPQVYGHMQRHPLGFVNLRVDGGNTQRGSVGVPAAFTNIQAGLQAAERLFDRQPGTNRQVILITDGEPTAHVRGDSIYLEYPPSEHTLAATLQEVKRCARRGITVNTFMLGEDSHTRRFVTAMTRINRGRALFASAESLGECILSDYVAHRGARAA